MWSKHGGSSVMAWLYLTANGTGSLVWWDESWGVKGYSLRWNSAKRHKTDRTQRRWNIALNIQRKQLTTLKKQKKKNKDSPLAWSQPSRAQRLKTVTGCSYWQRIWEGRHSEFSDVHGLHTSNIHCLSFLFLQVLNFIVICNSGITYNGSTFPVTKWLKTFLMKPLKAESLYLDHNLVVSFQIHCGGI